MEISEAVQNQILTAVSEIGTSGATITEIEKRVKFERHTVSKYLSFLQARGLIYHKAFGKAKVWFINTAPLQTVLSVLPEQQTFTEKILSDLITSLPYGLVVIDRDYNMLFMNKKMKEVYGQVEGGKFYSSVLGQENPLTIRPITKIITGKVGSAEVEVTDVLGNVLSLKATRLVHPDESSSVMLLLDDITERRKAEAEVLTQKTLLQAERDALNKSAIVAETDLDGRITYVNDRFVEVSGYTRKELLGQTHKIVNSGHHRRDFFSRMWKTITAGKVWKGEIKNKTKKGRFYWVDTSIAPVLDGDGKPRKFISIRFDVTGARKQ